MAQPPRPDSGQLERAIPALKLAVGSVEAMCGHTTTWLLPFPTHKGLILRVLLNKLSAHYPLSQSLLSEETSCSTPSNVTSFQNI